MILYTQHWDILPGKEDEYSNYVMSYYNPLVEKAGLHLVGGYYVAIGQGPRIISVAATKSLGDLTSALCSEEYTKATEGLRPFITKYDSRILTPTGRINADTYDIQTGLWKFTQYWNIIPGMEEPYMDFVKNDAIDAMNKLGLTLTGAWKLLVGSGTKITSESSATSLVAIAKAIDSDEFRRVVRKLKTTYVTDYSSRVLAPTGRIDIPYFMKNMMKGF
jgi:hypothetical protein